MIDFMIFIKLKNIKKGFYTNELSKTKHKTHF